MSFAAAVDRLNLACVNTFGEAATLNGVAMAGILNSSSELVLDGVLTQAPTFLARSDQTQSAAAGQSLVVGAKTYKVRQALAVPPDGSMTRLVLSAA